MSGTQQTINSIVLYSNAHVRTYAREHGAFGEVLKEPDLEGRLCPDPGLRPCLSGSGAMRQQPTNSGEKLRTPGLKKSKGSDPSGWQDLPTQQRAKLRNCGGGKPKRTATVDRKSQPVFAPPREENNALRPVRGGSRCRAPGRACSVACREM